MRWGSLNTCLLACRGLVEGLGPFRGWAQLSGELGLSGTPSGIRELRPPVGTSADDPSQTWHRVRHYWNLTPALAATQHHSRLLAPARQLVCRRDQRLLPPASRDAIVPASHRSRSPSSRNSSGGKLQTRYPAIRVAYGTARHQFACSDHPGYPRGIRRCPEQGMLDLLSARCQAIRVEYGSARHQMTQ